MPAVATRVVSEFRVVDYKPALGATAKTLTDLGYATLGAAQADYPNATALTDVVDRLAVTAAISACAAAGGGKVILPYTTFWTDQTITSPANVSVEGVRGSTIMKTTATTYDGWRVATGTDLDSNVQISNFAIRGPTGGVTSGTTAALKVDGSTNVTFLNMEAHQYPIGLDLVNNCYNCSFYNFIVPRFAACALGINLREGAQSGSDLYFFNSQLSAYKCCVNINGGGGGYYFYGFQWGNVNAGAQDDNSGVIQLGMNYITGVPNGTAAQILFDGGSIEGPHNNWFIRGFERAFVSFRNVSFQATATDATKMLGFMKWTSASNSMATFDGCELKGTFANTALTVISGAGVPIVSERDWRIEYNASSINANGTIYSGFGSWWGILWQAGIRSGRTEMYNCYCVDGRWWRISTASGVFEWSDDPTAATWKQLGTEALTIAVTDEVTAFTTGTNLATYRMPYPFKVIGVRSSLSTAQAGSGGGGVLTVDIKESGVSILGTKLSIDNTEKTSTTAATAATITDSTIADDAEITIDITQVGDGSARGLKVTLIGYRN